MTNAEFVLNDFLSQLDETIYYMEEYKADLVAELDPEGITAFEGDYDKIYYLIKTAFNGFECLIDRHELARFMAMSKL